jgi:hypothetical protein
VRDHSEGSRDGRQALALEETQARGTTGAQQERRVEKGEQSRHYLIVNLAQISPDLSGLRQARGPNVGFRQAASSEEPRAILSTTEMGPHERWARSR